VIGLEGYVESYAAVRLVLLQTLFLNLLVTAAKIAVGYLTGSLSIIADGFDSLFDSVTNVIGLVAIHLARRPPDEDHPYGHRRFETLMTLSVAALLFVTCYSILQSAYERLRNPTLPEVNVWSFAALLVSIAVHLFTARYETRRGKELRSEFLLADASHTSADILVTIGVIVGLIVVRMGYPWVDPAVAVVIALIIAKIGIDIIRSSARVLTDAVAIETDRVAAIIQQIPGVQSYHRIRSRGQEDDVHLDLHVRVAPETPLAQAHSIAHDVQTRLTDAIDGVRDVIVHVEPQPGAAHQPHDDLLAEVRAEASNLGLTVHHLAAQEIAGRYSLDLHLEVPDGLTLGEAHNQASLLEGKIRTQLPHVTEVHTHIEPAQVTHVECAEAMEDPRREDIVRQLTRDVPGVLDCHGVKLRHIGDHLSLTLHCTVDEHLPIARAHDIATVVEERVRRGCPDITSVSVHVEPSSTDT
jgi:cation diffusion facilitator family transporter